MGNFPGQSVEASVISYAIFTWKKVQRVCLGLSPKAGDFSVLKNEESKRPWPDFTSLAVWHLVELAVNGPNSPRLDEWQDAYKASKNAYFVFRVMNLGCQLAEHGCIRDLKAANAKWDSWWITNGCMGRLTKHLEVAYERFIITSKVLVVLDTVISP